jgi:hypothetical protein
MTQYVVSMRETKLHVLDEAGRGCGVADAQLNRLRSLRQCGGMLPLRCGSAASYSARPHIQCAPLYSAASYTVGATYTVRGLIYSATSYTGGMHSAAYNSYTVRPLYK